LQTTNRGVVQRLRDSILHLTFSPTCRVGVPDAQAVSAAVTGEHSQEYTLDLRVLEADATFSAQANQYMGSTADSYPSGRGFICEVSDRGQVSP